MSILIPCDEKNLPFLPNLTQIAAVATVASLSEVSTQIKWPNDILVNGRKICGILTEAITFGDKTSVVIGIGLNVNSERKNQGEIFAASLFDETGNLFDLDILAKEIAQNLIYNIEKLKENGLSEFIEILNEKLAFKNERKTIIDGNRRISGTIIAIGNGGELLFQTENGIEKIISGEISVV
jgi:BirA family biotin operon repressor/biotin-[acetyl-CoA-carboxylase] ligase